MFRALAYKELRETGWIALVALAIYFAVAASEAGLPILPFWNPREGVEVPFLDGYFVVAFCIISACFAIALGLVQTVPESARGTWQFLLHRPLGRRRIVAVKLAVGGSLYLLCAAAAILGYGLWAAVPATHASPFAWWMTADAWKGWAAIALLYPAAFLTGLRPARWFGTRLLPLVGVSVAALTLGALPLWPVVRVAALLLVAAGLLALIDFTAHNRDFS